MKKILLFLTMILFTVSLSASVNCDISGYVTFTQGGWSSPGNSTPGGIRDTYFDNVFPDGLVISGDYKLEFTSAQAVRDFLPQGGKPDRIDKDYVDYSKKVNVFAGQVVALTLNVYYDIYGYSGRNNPTLLRDLVIDDGPFTGQTVEEFLVFAQNALTTGFTDGYSYSQISDAATAINENFVDGTTNKGFLTCGDPQSSVLTDWDAGFYQSDSALCKYDSQWIEVSGYVDVTPEVTLARVQMAWRVVYPKDNPMGTSTNYSSFVITGDTTFSFSAWWPGIAADDDTVEIHYGVNVLDENGNPLDGKNGIGLDYYWYPWVCVPPAANESDLEITKTASDENPDDGDAVTYTVTVTNNGPENATGVEVTDLIPDGLLYTGYSASQGTYVDSTGIWTVGSLANGASAQLNLNVTVNINNYVAQAFNLGPAKDYNLFAIKDVNQPSSDTEGKMAAGRDITISNYSVGDKLPLLSGDVLVAGHNFNFTSGRVYHGNAVYGNSTNLPANHATVDGEVRKDTVIDFAAARAYLENLALTLKDYTPTDTTIFNGGQVLMNGTDPLFNIFTVNGDDLSNANSVVINAPNGSVVLVNISGANVTWKGALNVAGTSIENVLYNFYEAENLTISHIDVTGSILAPFADTEFPSGVVNGQAIFKSLTGTVQFNNKPFIGNLPIDTTVINVAQVTALDQNDPVATNNTSSATIFLNTTVEDNNNVNWEIVNNFTDGLVVTSMVTGQTGDIYAGTLGGRIYRSVDNGATWEVVNDSMFVGYIWEMSFGANGELYAATEMGVYKTADGETWEQTGFGAMDTRALAFEGNTLYAGTWGNGVFSSADGGDNWTEMNTGITEKTITSLAVNSTGELYAGTYGSGVEKYSGGSWSVLDVGFPYVWDLEFTSNDNLFAGTYGDGLYYSQDNGQNWSKAGFAAFYVYSVKVDEDDNVFATSYTTGVFLSTTYGEYWRSIGLTGYGINQVIVNSANQAPAKANLSANGYVFAASSNGTIYRTDASVTGVDDDAVKPVTYELFQNYPNPFNPTTTIKYSVRENVKVQMVVFDILGREVTTLVNEVKSPGTYEINFNASSLASGVYFYRMQAGKFSNVKKLMLIK